jgi:glucosamine kinase
MNEQFYVGIDAGGTHCRACLYNSEGNELGNSMSGPANVFSDFDSAIANIRLSINRVLALTDKNIQTADLHICVGSAGAQVKGVQQSFGELSHPYASFSLISDLHAACIGANAGSDCSLVIVGTGSSLASFENQQVKQYGGHGLFLGDEASGAYIGLSAIKSTLRYFDGLHNDKAFSDAILTTLSCTKPKQIVEHWTRRPAADYAALLPVVRRLAEEGNKSAQDLITAGLNYLRDVIIGNGLHTKAPLYMLGGLSNMYKGALEVALGINIASPQLSPEYGAFLYTKLMLNK